MRRPPYTHNRKALTQFRKPKQGTFGMALPSGFLGLLLLHGMLSGLAQGDVHFYDFVLKETNFTRLCSSKSMLVVNESLPGPVIRVTKGDTVFVNVHNQGDYGVTIHW